MLKFLALAITSALILSTPLLAGEDEGPFPRAEKIVLHTDDGAQLFGRRLRNDGGRPLVFLHGILENHTLWAKIATNLHQRGYDVFLYNLRGHGVGEFQSAPHLARRPDYSFEAISAYDVKAAIQDATQRSGKRVVAIGHSLGAMALKAFAAGLALDQEGAYLDEQRQEWLQQHLTGMISIAAPARFDGNYFIYQAFRFLPLFAVPATVTLLNAPLLLLRQNDIPAGLRGQLVKWWNDLKNGYVEFASTLWPIKKFFAGIFKRDNWERGEMSEFTGRQTSLVHAALLEDFVRYTQDGFISRNGKVDLGALKIPAGLPFLYISADEDRLAPAAHIRQDFQAQEQNDQKGLISFLQTGHVDAVSGQRARRHLAPVIDSFAKSGLGVRLRVVVGLDPYLKWLK